MKKYKFIVVGNGLIGSAAARYLSKECENDHDHDHDDHDDGDDDHDDRDDDHDVAIIGSPEPEDQSRHDGVFSSHYDQGRLVHQQSLDPIWSEICNRAVDNYGMLEEKSGIKFHGAVGRVLANKFSDVQRSELLTWMAEQKKIHGIQYRYFGADDRSWKEMFPYLDFPPGFEVFYDPAPSGFINPRRLIAAQNAIAKEQGQGKI